MSASAPTFPQIKAQVAAIRRKIPDARVIGIRASGRWTGEQRKQDGGQTYVIDQCDSPLAMRIALRDDGAAADVHVLITSLAESDLGEDILVRLTKRRLFPIDNWQIVGSLFQAQHIDPRLIRHRWLAEHMMDAIPPEVCRPAPGGFLDAETVWKLLLEHRIGLLPERPDLAALLRWSTDENHARRFRELPEEFRNAAVEWLTSWAGPAVPLVMACVAANERPDALAVGLVAGVLCHPQAAGQLDRAAGKMEERYLGGATLDPATVGRWHVAAAEVVRLQLAAAGERRQQLLRADEILREVGADALAFLNDTSPLGFDQRLSGFARCLNESLSPTAPLSFEPLLRAQRAVQEHVQSSREGRRLERIEMALRLLRWLDGMRRAEPLKPRSLGEAVAYQVREGGFVDWARLSLRSGEPVRELSEAYAKLFEAVTDWREKQSQQFAALLRNWTAAGSSGGDVLPVEQVLETVVAPLAGEASVLVIVIDGMSVAVCRELLASVTSHGWVALCQQGRDSAVAGVLSTVPSVTEVARTSLLCGQLRRGTANEERTGFAEHRALLGQSRGSLPPVLFHKAALQEEDDFALAAEVREAVASPQRRIVAVVVNAVDDYLLKSGQIDPRWTHDEIKTVAALLHEARQARRIVVLVSDHGHVLDCNTPGRTHEGGERWRPDEGTLARDELRIKGSRVAIGDKGSLIAPWSEKVRYGWKRNGYHGGLTPQEMVAPIAVLCATDAYPDGWVEAPVDTPSWWEELPREVSPHKAGSAGPKASQTPPARSLFDPAPDDETATEPLVEPSEEQVPEWIARLISSPVFEEQARLAGKMGAESAAIVRLLDALDRRGGRASSAVLAREIGYPSGRLRGLLAAAQRVLNVDGYPVLSHDDRSGAIQLDRDLLRRQFDLM